MRLLASERLRLPVSRYPDYTNVTWEPPSTGYIYRRVDYKPKIGEAEQKTAALQQRCMCCADMYML